MPRKTPHDQHDEPTLGCLDCAQRWPGRYRMRAVTEARRILDAHVVSRAGLHRINDLLDQSDPATKPLPWWRRTWARITGRRVA